MQPDIERLAVRMRTSSSFGRTTGGLATLPQDLLQESAQRVGIAAMVIGGLWAFGLVMNTFVYRAIGAQEHWAAAWNEVGRQLSRLSLLSSGRDRGPPAALPTELVIALGLVYHVVSAGSSLSCVVETYMHGDVFVVACSSRLSLVAPSTLRNVLSSLAAASTTCRVPVRRARACCRPTRVAGDFVT